MNEPSNSGSDNDKIIVEHYLVAFVDLLGQQEELSKMVSLPVDDPSLEYQDFIKVLKKTVGSVKSLQKDASIFFKSFAKSDQSPLSALLPVSEKMRTRDIKFKHFSDGLVIYVPLGNRHESSAISAVYGVLISCGFLTLLGLAKKEPVRIGISVGLATEVDGEIYGKALADAYVAESKIAQLPRAVVTSEVLDYINYKMFDKEETIFSKFDSAMADKCGSILSYDYDGHAIVDYLSHNFISMVGNDQQLVNDIIPKAFGFVKEQLELHQVQKNSKLAMRYSLLHGYFSQYLKHNT